MPENDLLKPEEIKFLLRALSTMLTMAGEVMRALDRGDVAEARAALTRGVEQAYEAMKLVSTAPLLVRE